MQHALQRCTCDETCAKIASSLSLFFASALHEDNNNVGQNHERSQDVADEACLWFEQRKRARTEQSRPLLFFFAKQSGCVSSFACRSRCEASFRRKLFPTLRCETFVLTEQLVGSSSRKEVSQAHRLEFFLHVHLSCETKLRYPCSWKRVECQRKRGCAGFGKKGTSLLHHHRMDGKDGRGICLT